MISIHKQTKQVYLHYFFFIILLVQTSFVFAFYEWQNEHGGGDLRLLLRGFVLSQHNPHAPGIYTKTSEEGAAALARLITQVEKNEHLSIELNAYQTYIPAPLVSGQSNLGSPLDVERSAYFEWSFSDEEFVHLTVDRLNVRWSQPKLDVTLGRQTVNLATTFYFTPNDFFAPFSAQAFYRVYKPGVDAVRAELSLGRLSQLNLIGVAGYQRNLDTDTGWDQSPDSDRASYLVRFFTEFQNAGTSIFTGLIQDDAVFGGSLQTEFWQWLGVRTEGHIKDDEQTGKSTEAAVGIEHRWANGLDARMELFFHDQGADKVSKYSQVLASGNTSYLGRKYAAAGLGYEFTPLLIGQALIIDNLVDSSYLLSFNAVYSLADEAEMSINLSLPMGDKPQANILQSEFGTLPVSFNIEIRWYF